MLQLQTWGQYLAEYCPVTCFWWLHQKVLRSSLGTVRGTDEGICIRRTDSATCRRRSLALSPLAISWSSTSLQSELESFSPLVLVGRRKYAGSIHWQPCRFHQYFRWERLIGGTKLRIKQSSLLFGFAPPMNWFFPRLRVGLHLRQCLLEIHSPLSFRLSERWRLAVKREIGS